MDTEQILDLFFARDENAIAQTDFLYGTKLLHLAQGILENKEDAEECKNDTYLRAWNAIPPGRPEHYFAWLVKVCRRLAFDRLDWAHAKKRDAQIVELTTEMEECIPAPDDICRIGAEELVVLMKHFLKEQPKLQRQLFIRRYWYGQSIRELAKELVARESKVKVDLFRTRNKLREYLEKEGIIL